MNSVPPVPPELWEHTPVAVREYLRCLAARVASLEATGQHVRERLQQGAHNSSRPPSRAPPQALRKRTRRGPRGRKRGGQPGPPGQPRALVPTEEVDTLVPVKPTPCSRCQHPWGGEEPQPHRHQV